MIALLTDKDKMLKSPRFVYVVVVSKEYKNEWIFLISCAHSKLPEAKLKMRTEKIKDREN